ncbi:6-phosphofructokinase [Metabacillus endolithicus]|uniref:6-phosphofructokinase n=1 Tax=Metabacillus endolithicus TaxID=1535204 RepID=A0ABW5C4Z0_9BACI|nr:6-phosphofructokinase [Metabacillus endolithicus]UPG65141.1 6-phosphofructokinase [Metabacillus endolithicus]
MKIGVVHFGCALAGASEIVRTLVEEAFIQGDMVYGIEWNASAKKIQQTELDRNSLHTFGFNRYRLNRFSINIWNEQLDKIASELSELDQVILLGDTKANLDHFTSKLLVVPISYYNNINGSQATLGYDTALNSIVESIESVRDTASSLSYGKVRVFNVQIPGYESSRLLNDTALAVDAEVVDQVSGDVINHLKQHIRNKEANKEGYTFFVMDNSVDPEELGKHFEEFDLDWKAVVIDESQCGGPYPTAVDRLLANQLKRAVVEWVRSNHKSGQLLIQDNKVILSELKQSEGIK